MNAIIALAGEGDDEDHGILLLEKLHQLFGPVSMLSSKEIVEELRDDDDLPFGDITARGVAALLRPYGIKPRNVRIGQSTPKGYRRDQFTEVFARYVPTQAPQAPQAPHPSPDAGSGVADSDECGVAIRHTNGKPPHEIPDEHGDVADVADVADRWDGGSEQHRRGAL